MRKRTDRRSMQPRQGQRRGSNSCESRKQASSSVGCQAGQRAKEGFPVERLSYGSSDARRGDERSQERIELHQLLAPTGTRQRRCCIDRERGKNLEQTGEAVCAGWALSLSVAGNTGGGR